MASRGFSLREESVWHPTGAEAVIGKVKAVLDPDMYLVDEFIQRDANGNTNQSQVLGFLTNDTKNYETVSLDPPSSRRCDGVVSAVQLKRLSVGEHSSLQNPSNVIWSMLVMVVMSHSMELFSLTEVSSHFFRSANDNGYAIV